MFYSITKIKRRITSLGVQEIWKCIQSTSDCTNIVTFVKVMMMIIEVRNEIEANVTP